MLQLVLVNWHSTLLSMLTLKLSLLRVLPRSSNLPDIFLTDHSQIFDKIHLKVKGNGYAPFVPLRLPLQSNLVPHTLPPQLKPPGFTLGWVYQQLPLQILKNIFELV